MRPHLKRWRRSRITSPSTRTVSTRSANRRRQPGFGGCLTERTMRRCYCTTPPSATERSLTTCRRARSPTERSRRLAGGSYHMLPMLNAFFV
jgi:hypothetical protein